jgi:hypothetical protein
VFIVPVVETCEKLKLPVSVEIRVEASRFAQLERFLPAGVLMRLSLKAKRL